MIMVIDGLRGMLLRSSVVVRFLLSLCAVPQASRPVVVAVPDVQPVPADRVTVLFAQFTAGVRGCRAPPAASV